MCSPRHFADPEAQIFEDAVCLTFLQKEFVAFAAPYLSTTPAESAHVNPDKLGGIVAKTWAKMTLVGRGVAVEELVGTLPDELRSLVLEAVGTVQDNQQ